MAELSVETFTNDWWPTKLKLRELEYENSKLLVQKDGLMFQKWKSDIDMVLNEEKLFRQSQTLTELTQTSKEQQQLLQDEVRSLERELKECKDLLCQAKKSLKDVKEESRVKMKRLEERLTLKAEEMHAKEQENFEKERDTLNKEIEKWKSLKEKLDAEKDEMENTLRLEADEKIKQQENKAKNEIESLCRQLQTWKDNHKKAKLEIEDLQAEISNKTVVTKAKGTQTQAKMVSKSVTACVGCVEVGIQVVMLPDSDDEGGKGNTSIKESKKPAKKQNRELRKTSVQCSKNSEPEKDSLSESTEHTSGSDNEQQSEKQSKKNTSDKKNKPDVAPLKKTTMRKSVRSKNKKSSDEEDVVPQIKSTDGKVHDGVHGDVLTGVQEDLLNGEPEDLPNGAPKDLSSMASEDLPTRAPEDLPTGVHKEVSARVHQDETCQDSSTSEYEHFEQEQLPGSRSTKGASKILSDKPREEQDVGVINNKCSVNEGKALEEKTSDKNVRKLRKRKSNKECSTTDEIDAKKVKANSKTTPPSSNNEISTRIHDNTPCADKTCILKDMTRETNDENQEKIPAVNKKTSRKTKNQQVGPVLMEKNDEQVKDTSQPKHPSSSRPTTYDRSSQSNIAEISSILNGTKRQKTLFNTKDNSLMVSFLPVQESFMSSTMSRGHKSNGTMPPSLSAFMRSFVAPKLKKKTNS